MHVEFWRDFNIAVSVQIQMFSICAMHDFLPALAAAS